MAKHSFALRDIVATRGRVDPSALVLRVQGLRALAHLPRVIRLLLRGKINPLKTFFKIKTAAVGSGGPHSRAGSRQMKFAYYPGCSARSTCAELNEATHLVAAKLGLELLQLESATCTGARELRAIDPVGFYTLNVRILALAESHGLPLMTICNTCTLNVLDAHAAFVNDKELAASINARLAEEGLHYSGRTRISHFLWVLHENIGEQRLRELVVNPLTGLTVGAFYGCHITRPPLRYGFVDSRNNTALEKLAEILGCQPIDYSGRTECCGFHTAAHDERVAIKLTGQHILAAKAGGAQAMVTPVPAVPHRSRRLPARNREGRRAKARHADPASAATGRPGARIFAGRTEHRPAHGARRRAQVLCGERAKGIAADERIARISVLRGRLRDLHALLTASLLKRGPLARRNADDTETVTDEVFSSWVACRHDDGYACCCSH